MSDREHRRCGACNGTGRVPISEPLQDVFDAVRFLESAHGAAPSSREVAGRVGVPLNTALVQRLRTLEQLTLIYRGPRRGRSLTWATMPF